MKEQIPVDISNFKRKYRERNEGEFPNYLKLELLKESDLKYGENPNQHGAVYCLSNVNDRPVDLLHKIPVTSIRSDSEGKGGLSLTNLMDIRRAMDTLKFFDSPAVAIMKHNVVSGFAKQIDLDQSLEGLFRLARDADLRSNFGGTAVFNRPLNVETAHAMYELKGSNPFFVDVVAAPEYDDGTLSVLEKESKNLRIAKFSGLNLLPKFMGDLTGNLSSFKDMSGGSMGVQDLYLTSIRGVDDLIFYPYVVDKNGKEHLIEWAPHGQEIDDLLTAWYLNIAGLRSNGVNVVKDGVSIAIGSGQVERVGAIEQMIIKGMQKAMDREGITYDPLKGIEGYEKLSVNPFKGAACSSDAFFPFPDSIEMLARVRITAVVQPYGSVRDDLVIDAANKYKIAMPATLERCFGHF